MENAGMFNGHLEYFTVIWYTLWPFGNVVIIWYIFPRFGTLSQERSGNPGLGSEIVDNPKYVISECPKEKTLVNTYKSFSTRNLTSIERLSK
jgi:hypothetical protein